MLRLAYIYRITSAKNSENESYFNLWNDSSFLHGVASSKKFSSTGEYVDVRVSTGQVLDVWNAYVTYVGP